MHKCGHGEGDCDYDFGGFHLHLFDFTFVYQFYSTGRPVCIGTVGVASKPVEPHPLSFAGFFIYIQRKFVANLKLIGALMWR